MIVQVIGLEQFCGDIKARYRRDGLVMSDNPEQHHDAFAANLDGARLVDAGHVHGNARPWLVSQWEQDTRLLVGDMVECRDGRISYRLYEITQ